MISWKRLRAPCLVGTLALLTLGVGTASADIFTSTLGVGNTAISGFTAPYGTVKVDLTSPTMATITFTGNVVNGNTYLFGDGGTAALNLNATSFTVGTITGTNSNPGFTPGPTTFAGSGNEDGFGTFNLTLNSFDGFTHSSDTVTFTVTDTSGTWSSAANVLTANAGGWDAAAHIFVCANPCNASEGALSTGFAAESASTVPEPTAIILLGSSMIGLGAIVRRRRSSRVA